MEYRGMKENILGFFSIFIVLLLGVIGWGAYWLAGGSVPSITPPLPTPTIAIPANWQTYTNKQFKYSVRYPAEYEQDSNGDYSSQLVKKNANLETGPAKFIYISVIPQGFNNEEVQIYNYDPTTSQQLFNLKVGEEVKLGDTPELSEYFTYTRIPDEKLNGSTARVLVNKKPWQFPIGTTEYRYYIKKGHITYLVGGYISRQNAAQFKRIISTFTLLQ